MFSLLVRMAWEEQMEKKRHTTASGEDYLEAILVLKKKLGIPALDATPSAALWIGEKSRFCGLGASLLSAWM